LPRRSRDVREIAWTGRIGHVDDGGAVLFVAARDRILPDAAVMTDVRDEAGTLLVHEGLIGRARLQRLVADEAHVLRFRTAGGHGERNVPRGHPLAPVIRSSARTTTERSSPPWPSAFTAA